MVGFKLSKLGRLAHQQYFMHDQKCNSFCLICRQCLNVGPFGISAGNLFLEKVILVPKLNDCDRVIF